MESPRRLFLLLAFMYSAVAVPLTRKETCARHCTESNRFQFRPGSTYTYDYETMTTTNVKGTSDERSQLQMKAQVDIEVLDKCDFSLRFRGVTLKQSDPQNPEYLSPIKGGREFSRATEKYILRFSYQDGVVHELCPDKDAPAWITNIQRGVLSAFQNSMNNLEGNERLIETDVSGKCSVEYQSLGRSWRGTLTIRKLKDLNACTNRQNADTSFQGAPFTHGSSIRSMPIVKGSQECEQSIGDGILQSSTCTETHVLRPFSRGSGGAATTVNQKLTFVTVSKQSFTGNDYRPTRENLLFDHGREEDISRRSGEEAERALAKICEASVQDMTISVPGLFASFVYRMRQLDYDTFRSLYTRVDTICPNNPKARKFFLDAIPVVATLTSVKFMSEMIARKEVSPTEINFWFSSLSFVSEPSAEMIAILMPLLDGSHDQAFFGISSLVHTFCERKDCSMVSEVRAIVHKLTDNLGENCFNPDVRKILLTLKSIANIGIPFGREKILERCAMNPQLETEVRISAIQAFRRFSCHTSRETFLKMYSNYNEGSEMRIAAYLATMACPTREILQSIRETLEKEQINQVGSFVWTHLRALAKSQHPGRQDIKDILSSLYLLNKYETDIRKFSSAREATFYLESIDSGLHVDTHLIYPTNSYLPHSATFNLTVDIFGHSCNLLQLDGRLEGMEKVLERLFGPDGFFPQRKVSNLLRNKRSLSDNKIERMDQEFDVKSHFEKKPYGSLDVKIFGNTLWYNQFQEDENGGTTVNLMDLITELAQKQEKEFSRSFMFLDSTYSIPMATGLPLRLSLNGTATVGLKLGGKFNVRSLQNIDVIANVEPSGAVEMAGLLTVDAGGVTRTGLRIAATLHSSTVLDSLFEVRNGQVIKAQLNMPREKIEIIDVQSKLYLVYGDEEREQAGQRDSDYHFSGCSSQISRKLLDVELCTDISLPKGQRNSPMYPMSGAASFSMYLKKTDPKLTSYTFDMSYESKTLNGKTIRDAAIALNTPKSSTDREVSLQFHLSEVDNSFTFDLKSPIKKLGVIAKFANGKALKKLDLSATVDEKNTFSAKSELRISSEDNGISYFPSLEVQIPSKRLLSIAGSAHLKHGLKYGGLLTIKELTQKPILIKGNLDVKNRDRYEAELAISSFALDSTTKASFQRGDTMFVKLNTDYRIMESTQQKININGKIRDLSANALRKYTSVLNMQATAFPEWDTSVSWESMKTTGHFENTFSIAIGDGTRSRVHTINVQEIVRYKGNLKDNKAEITLKFSYPERRMNYAFEMKHENSARTLKNELEIQYAKNRKISTLVNVDLHAETTLDFSGSIQVHYPGRKTRLSTDIREESPRNYRGELNVQWQEGQHLGLVSHYRNRGDEQSIKHEADAELTFSYRQPITFSCSIAAQKGHYAGAAEITFGLDKYRINADYLKGHGLNHRFSGQVFYGSELYVANALMQNSRDKFTSNVEFKLPSRRRVVAKLDIKNSPSLKTLSLESMWDADRDSTKNFGLDAEVRIKSNGYDGKVTMQIQRRTIRGFISTSREGHLFGNYLRSLYKTEVQWSPNDKVTMTLNTNILRENYQNQISSALDIQTSYSGYESININVKHGSRNQQWSSEATATWGYNKRIGLTTDGKYASGNNGATFETTAKFNSPFKNYESILFNATHFQDSLEFSNKMQLQWNKKDKITTDVYNNFFSSGFKGGMKITTPFASISDLSFEATHNYASGSYKTNGALQWAPNKKINAAFDLRHALSGRRRTYSVNFVASSPFRGYETLSTKLIYNNDGTTINTDMEVQYNEGKKITSGFTGSYQNTYYSRNVDGKLYFTSPIVNYENLQMSTSFQSTSNSYKFNIDTQAPYQKSVTFNSVGKIMSWQDIEFNIVFSGRPPLYNNMQRLSFDLVHKLQNSNLRSTFDFAYGRKQVTVLVTGTSKPGYKSQNIEGSLSINTPFRGYEEIKVDGIHKHQDWEYMTRIEINKNREHVLLVHNANIKDFLNVESSLRLTSSLSGFNDITCSLSQLYNPGYFAHDTKVQWGRNEVVEFNAQYQSKVSTKELNVRLSTPSETLKSFVFTAEHESDNLEYKSKAAAQWNDKRGISISSNIINDRMQHLETEIRITSNLDSPRMYQLIGKYDVTSPQKTALFTLQWDHKTKHVISVSGNVLISNPSPKFEIVLSTPYRGFEQVSVVGVGENRSFKKQFSLSYARNKITAEATANFEFSGDGARYEINIRSPFQYMENLSFYTKYQKQSGLLSADMDVQWAQDKRLSLAAEMSRTDNSAEGKLSLTTPFVNYERLSMDGSIDISKRKRTANIVFRWGSGKKIELYTDCEVRRRSEGTFTIRFRSPFKNFQQLDAASHYRVSADEYNADLEIKTGNKMSYKGQVNYNRDGIFTASLNTPHRPLRNVVLVVSLINNIGHHEVKSNIKWENKEMDFALSFKNNNYLEFKLNVNTPFENFREFSFNGTFRNHNFQAMDGQLSIVTPFKFLHKLDVSMTFTSEYDVYDAVIKVVTPSKTTTVIGHWRNSLSEGIRGSLSVDAPFTSFRNFTIRMETDLQEKAVLSVKTPHTTHSLTGSIGQDDTRFDLELKIESPLLKRGSLWMVLKSNFKESSNIQVDAAAEVAGERHNLVATYRRPRNDYEYEITTRSSFLPGKKAELKGSYTERRQRRTIEAKLLYSGSNHQVKATYDTDSRQISAGVAIDSNILPSSSLKINAKYVNGNNRDIEMTFSLETPQRKHSVVASVKNYEGEKFFQLKVECPLLYSRQFSVTGTLKYDQLNAVDGVVTVTYPGKEFRIAVNMKRNGWRNVEGFLTLNTPFESLRMLRIDAGFKNDRYKNMEWNIQIESSNSNYPTVSISAKLSRTDGSEDMSLMLRLPNTEFHTIQVLGNLHYNPDKTNVDARLTLSLPPKRYSMYGQYGLGNSELSLDGELEWNNKKWTAVGHLENKLNSKGISFILNIPDHGAFETVCSLSRTNNLHTFTLTYSDLQQEKFKVNATVNYASSSNADATLDMITPFANYRQVKLRLQYHREMPRTCFVHVESNINYRKVFFTFSHRTDAPEQVFTSVTLGSPLRILKDVKINFVKEGLKEINMDFTHNQQRKVKIHISNSKSAQVLKVDLPLMPFTITAKMRPRDKGREISVKSNSPTRTMSFNSVYQCHPTYFAHEATLVWDEASRSAFSYNTKLSDVSKGQMSGKEFFGRINFPRRSFELRGKMTRSGRVQSGGVNFYWDAGRDLSKNMTFGVEHQDVSTRHQTSHKLQMILTHPSLTRDLVQTNLMVIGPTEFRAKSELQYSRYNEHNFVAEVKANDFARNGEDTHYKTEISLRHLVTHIDFKMVGEIANNREEAFAHVKINSVGRSGHNAVPEIKAKILKLRKEIDIIMRSAQNNFSMLGRMFHTDEELSMTLNQKLNDRRGLYSEFKFNDHLKSLEVNVNVGESKSLHLTASFPEDSASVKISHSTKVNSVTDAFLFVGLEKSRILKSRLNWRPEMWREFRIVTGDSMRALFSTVSNGINDISSELRDGYRTKVQEVHRTISNQVAPFQNAVQRDMDSIRADVKAAADTLKQMYRNNEFYVQDISQRLQEGLSAFRSFCGAVSVIWDAISNTFMEWLEDMYYTIYYGIEDLCKYLSQMYYEMLSHAANASKKVLDTIANGFESLCSATNYGIQRLSLVFKNFAETMATRIDNWVRSYAPCIIDMYYTVKMAADRIREKARNSFNGMVETVTSHPLYVALADYWSQVKATIESFQLADLTSSVQSRVLFLGEQAGTFMSRLSDVELIDIIRNRLPVDYVSSAAKVTLQKGMDLYGALGVDRLINSLLSYAMEYFKDAALSSGHEILHQFYELRDGAKYTFDPKHGLFVFEYALPTSSNSIYEVFNVGKYMEYQEISDIKESLIAKYYEDFCIWDFYYKIKNFFSPRRWMPPFTAHAMVAGNQHFVTFDKFAFDFAGECSYLLSRDFVDGNFTVVANYKRDGPRVLRKSLTVIAESNKVEISHDYKVTLNDVKVELPFKVVDTIAIREGSTVRIENERKGFVVICNFVHDVCTVGISGFYFGKTGGLFGTYDNEPRLDFLTPEMNLASDVENFANSWEVGQATCRSSSNMATVPGNDYRVEKRCKELFATTNSIFRSCFKQVDPEPYLRMCISDLSAVDESRFDSVICSSAAAYFTECRIEDVQLKMPKTCVRCETEHGSPMIEGNVAKFHRNRQARSADIVFIVEEKECNSRNFAFMEKFAHSIEDNFRQQGFLDIRYRVVGFGGDDVHAEPHIHTIDGKEYGSVRSVNSAFQSLQVGYGPSNILEALRFAAALNYHPGSVKSFVLMKCLNCKAEENRVAYGEVLRTLLDGEIALHLLMEQKYEMRIAKNSKARKVIGLDKNFAYTLKDIKDSNLLGDGDLLIHLKLPKDICVPLALELNGSTFDSQYLTDTKRNNYKKFMDVVSRRMVLSTKHGTEWTMCCECIATNEGVGKSTCQRCVSPQVANMISADATSFYPPSPKENKKDSETKVKVRKPRERKRGNH